MAFQWVRVRQWYLQCRSTGYITRYVDGTPTSEVTPVIIWYIHPRLHGQIGQYHDYEWMTHILFVPCQSEIRLFQTLTLKLQGQGHRGWSKGKVIQLAQYLINSLPFHFTSIRPTRYSYIEIWPWNIQGQGHEWGHQSRSHIIPSIKLMHFLFVSHQSNQPFLRYRPWKNKSEFFKENLSK